MVLIAAAVVTKNGKNLVTRQFVTNMPRSRLEGLLEAFPKLLGTDVSQRQHTFVETDSVRYVYQPLDDIYVVLVTTKASNILEDLEALRLFSRVIPEYCRSNDEAEILNKAFELIFAFDEIVALGYRENVNLALIRTFTEMDSHEERVHKQILNAQMRDATNKAQQRAKELKKGRETAMGNDVGVIRWWLVLSDEEQLPLVLNVFPNETPDGCTVNIEYILQNEALTLQNVLIAIPLAPATQPIVSEAEGSYEYIRSKSQLLWSIPIIDESNSSGNLEFSVPNGHSDQFFPVNVNFESESLVCQIELEDAVTFDGSESVEHTAETAFVVDKYEVV
uniref:Coatomer subunit delta n=1 Tax=Panagrellus redivivus TaxID=6233 RepID=A0A7E4WB78_PANRE